MNRWSPQATLMGATVSVDGRRRCGLHPAEREREISRLLRQEGFASFGQLCARLEASRATVRRDLERMASDGRLRRVHGGVKPLEAAIAPTTHDRARRSRADKACDAIARCAAGLMVRGEAIVIDGGGSSHALCQHMDGLDLQVLTNSLTIATTLSGQVGARVMMPGGSLHPEQGIIVDPFEDREERFRGSKLFVWAQALGEQGLMQSDPLLVRAQQKLMRQADELVVLIESRNLGRSACFILCSLGDIDVVVTDAGIAVDQIELIQRHNVRLMIADARGMALGPVEYSF